MATKAKLKFSRYLGSSKTKVEDISELEVLWTDRGNK